MQTIFQKSIHLLAAVNWKENQKSYTVFKKLIPKGYFFCIFI